jgi:hypothetical protein
VTTAEAATNAVFVGNHLPAHDRVFDLAGVIAAATSALVEYVEAARPDTPGQGRAAARELLAAITEALDT